jgi:hypothetical protein
MHDAIPVLFAREAELSYFFPASMGAEFMSLKCKTKFNTKGNMGRRPLPGRLLLKIKNR